MPELPQSKLRPHPKESAGHEVKEGTGHQASGPSAPGFVPGALPYAELHVTSNFTFLTGASHPDELVEQAAALGYRAIAITDVNTVAGIVRAHVAAEQIGMQLIVGCHLKMLVHHGARGDRSDGAGSSLLSVLVYPTDTGSYARLCRLLTLGKRRAEKGECLLYLHDLIEHAEGLLAIIVPPAILDGEFIEVVEGLRRVFDDDRMSMAACCAYGQDDRVRLEQLAALSAHTRVPLVACNDVQYHHYERRALHDVLTCIREGCTIEQAGFRLQPNAERYLKPPEELARLFVEYPEALRRTIDIADRTRGFNLNQLRYQYPDEICPPGLSPMDYLKQLTWLGARERYGAMHHGEHNENEDHGDNTDFIQQAGAQPRLGVADTDIPGLPEKVRRQIEHEFRLIEALNYAPYFLTVYDLVKFARSRGILCQGRGAAANSAVCYCLGLTSVDPDRIDVLFERFISLERKEPPDIDIDFEHERREEVIQYIYQKYGRDRAALTAEVISYRGRSAVRDVGKALGLSLDLVDRLAKNIDWWSDQVTRGPRLREEGIDPDDPTIRRFILLAMQIMGFPRHLSQHVGGFVITRGPLCDLVPIENARMDDRTVIEWDKDDIDALGMLKVDVLGLGMLTAVRKCFDMVNGKMRKEIKGLRERGTECRKELNDESDQDISGFSGVAKGDETCQRDVPYNAMHAPGGEVRIDAANEASSGFHSFQYCGGVRSTWQNGLPPLSQDRKRLSCRTGDAIRTGYHHEHDVSRSDDTRIAPRDGACSSVTHQCSGTKAVIDIHQSLNPSVPQSLNPSVPQSLSPALNIPSHRSPPPLQLHTIPPEDPAVYDMICKADTIGVFQIESRAQMQMLPRLRPRCFYDLVIEVAIVRPGPIQGDMVHPYLRRRNGTDPVTYPDDKVKAVLAKTLGVPLFQEQAMALAIVAAGFTPGEADQLRRAMAAWKRPGNLIEKFQCKFVGGMLERGYSKQFAMQCFNQLKGFSEYGFPESHAASFALIVYVSAWLKKHHPAEFAAALINSQPMGFYAPAQIVRDAQDHGVEVRPVDVNWSEWDCTLEDEEMKRPRDKETEKCGAAGSSPLDPTSSVRLSVSSSLPPSLRLGMRLVKGLREDHAKQIAMAVREHGPFDSVEELWRTAGVPIVAMRKLASADAFNSMGLDRQHALWQVRALHDERLEMFEKSDEESKRQRDRVGEHGDATSSLRLSVSPSLSPALPPVPPLMRVMHDYASLNLSLKAHPVSFIRDMLNRKRVTPARELEDEGVWKHGKRIAVAGIALVRQRPATASGVVFITIEDETGVANLIVRPKVFEKYRRAARHGIVLLARGTIERQCDVVHIMTHSLEMLDSQLRQLTRRSRDFH